MTVRVTTGVKRLTAPVFESSLSVHVDDLDYDSGPLGDVGSRSRRVLQLRLDHAAEDCANSGQTTSTITR